MSDICNILFLGDVFGKTGRKVLKNHLQELKKEFNAGLVIANGENACHGNGINQKSFFEMTEAGVDVVTGGNHTFQNKEVFELIEMDLPNMLIPANYPPGVPGNRHGIFKAGDLEILVINMHGRVLINKNFDSPFDAMEKLLKKFSDFKGPVIVDFHAEATSEKRAFGMHFDGRITAIIGTHTHIQTADERIQPGGTAYITDAGMCGAYDSVIGITLESVIDNFLYELPTRFEVSPSAPSIQGVVVNFDRAAGKASKIERVLKIYR